MTKIKALTEDFYARLVRVVQYVEALMRSGSSPAASPYQASRPNPGNLIFVGRISEKAPNGTDFVAGSSDRVYPVRICFLPQDATYAANATILGNSPADDADGAKIVWATNLSEAVNRSGSNNQSRLLPGQSVLLFMVNNRDGQERYVFTSTPAACLNYGSGNFWDAGDPSNYAKAWDFWLQGITDLPATWSYVDERTPFTHNVTLAQYDKNPREALVKTVCRFVQGDVSTLPMLKSRRVTFDYNGNMSSIGAEGGTGALDETLGERVTYVTDVQLVEVGDQITLQKKTREAIVFWKGTESAWTNAGTVTDTDT